MKKFFKYLAIVLVFAMCKQPTNSKQKIVLEAEMPVQKDCFDKSTKETILTAILRTETFQEFLHPELEERLPVRLVKSDFITDDLQILSNAQKVGFRDSLGLPKASVHRITIKNVDCENKTLEYSIFYPIEGVIIGGYVEKKNGEWTANVSHVGEMSIE